MDRKWTENGSITGRKRAESAPRMVLFILGWLCKEEVLNLPSRSGRNLNAIEIRLVSEAQYDRFAVVFAQVKHTR